MQDCPVDFSYILLFSYQNHLNWIACSQEYYKYIMPLLDKEYTFGNSLRETVNQWWIQSISQGNSQPRENQICYPHNMESKDFTILWTTASHICRDHFQGVLSSLQN